MKFKVGTETEIDLQDKIDAIIQEDEIIKLNVEGRERQRNAEREEKGMKRQQEEETLSVEDLTPEQREEVLRRKNEEEEKKAQKKQKSAEHRAKSFHILKIIFLSTIPILFKIMNVFGSILCIITLPKFARCIMGVKIESYDTWRASMKFMDKPMYCAVGLLFKIGLWFVALTFLGLNFKYLVPAIACMIVTISGVSNKKELNEAAKNEKNKKVEVKEIEEKKSTEITDEDIARFLLKKQIKKEMEEESKK